MLAGRKVYDLTLPLGCATPVYPGDPRPAIRRVSEIAGGDALTASEIAVGCHVGTHVDLPGHFLPGGDLLEAYPVERFIGPAQVVEIRNRRVIEKSDLEPIAITRGRHLLLKTDNSAFVKDPDFRPAYTYLSPDAVGHLLAFEPLSLGIDYYSLDPAESEDFPSHRLAAASGLPVFVCLVLGGVPPGLYQLAALPLYLPAAEGVPIRAILWS